MDWLISPNGFLRSPNLHDGSVKGIRLDGEKRLSIELEAVDGPTYILRLEGLDRLLCDGFAEGNIILHIAICRGVTPSLDSVRRLCGGLHPDVKEPYRARHEQWIERVVDTISTGRQTFIEIVPSYGAEILALCDSISIDSASNDDALAEKLG